MYKKDNRFGPGILKYPSNTEDVGFWNCDNLVRLLVPLNIKFECDELEPLENEVTLSSWYDRENLLFETLNPQNLFLNRVKSSKSNQFIRDDPYIEKVLKHKTIFYDEFIHLFQKYLKQGKDVNIINEFKKTKTFKVKNITPHLLEIFKHFQRFSYFYQNLQSADIQLNVEGFENCNFWFFLFYLFISDYCLNFFDLQKKKKLKANRELYGPPGLHETNSIEFLKACYERNLDKVKQLRQLVDINVCDNQGYSPIILAVVNIILNSVYIFSIFTKTSLFVLA